jgi:hypothetical protein
MTKSRSTIKESFVVHTKEMRESWAWRLLPDIGRRILDRIELEHMRHAGTGNGQLVVSYSQFEEWDIRRQSIPLGIRQTVALGFLQVPRKGYRTTAGFKAPSLYRLTYVFNADARTGGIPTNEWRRHAHERDAREALRRASEEDAEAKRAWRVAKDRRDRLRASGRAAAPQQGAKASPKRARR